MALATSSLLPPPTRRNTRRPLPTDEERLRVALSRASSYRTRPSTVAAEEFFSPTLASEVAQGVAGGARGARRRLRLRRRGVYKGEGASGNIDDDQYEEEEDGYASYEREEIGETLPRRVVRLAERLLETTPKNGGGDGRYGEGRGSAFVEPVKEENNVGLVPVDCAESRRLEFGAAVFARAGPGFVGAFGRLFAAALERRRLAFDRECGFEEEEEEYGEGLGWDEAELYAALRCLGWLDGKLARPFGEALHDAVLSAVRKRIGGQYHIQNTMGALVEWKENVAAPWVSDAVGPDAYDRDGWDGRLDCALSECFCDVRIGEMFEIVADFPDSLPAVLELRDALDRTSLHGRLARELESSLRRRLIHPGAATAQIIDVYVSLIRVLREIDPSDGLLHAVAEPVRSCLRGRADTVRCIVAGLIDEEQAGGELYEELRRMDARPLEQARCDSDDDGEDGPDYADWMPAPKHRGVMGRGYSVGGRWGGGGDILSMMVNIYGSKELFVNEYRVMLAHKLLANLDFDTDREVHNLELLKLRFGETSMRSCEIMIKDLDDSKRINANIHSTIRNRERDRKKDAMEDADSEADGEKQIARPPVDAAIVSHIFWPALQKESLAHHPCIKSRLDEFSLEYAKLKNPRRLVWLDQLGSVSVELEVMEEDEDGAPRVFVREFSCSPLQATLISHFEDRNRWTASELSEVTGVSEDVVRRRMGLFVNGRVVRIDRSGRGGGGGGETAYELASVDEVADAAVAGIGGSANDRGRGGGGGGDGGHDDDDDDGDAGGGGVSSSAQEAEEMAAYESYIVGMLTNLGQLPLERIHEMLKMYVTGSEHRYDWTPRQLAALLRRMCKEARVEVGPDGMYKLVKK